MGVTKLCQVGFEHIGFILRYIDTSQDTSVVRTVIAVVKQADVPIRADCVQEVEKGARAFREFEAKQACVANTC